MLSLSSVSIPETLTSLRQRGIKAAFLVPTATGLDKSIMDAHHSLRFFLSEAAIHDFTNQPQGTEHKRLVPTLILSRGKVIDTQTSLYRPQTKDGDPRIWVYGLKEHALEGDLLAIAWNGEKLVVINCPQSDMVALLDDPRSIVASLFPITIPGISETASGLLDRLRDISSRGFIKNTGTPGDKAVGETLETLLGIAANPSRAPDYRGIELKSGRSQSHLAGQVTLWSKVPNWNLSSLKSSKAILKQHGRYSEEKQRWQIFHEISCKEKNSYDLQLEFGNDGSRLYQIYVPENQPKEKDVVWLMETLEECLVKKHRETMWVEADSRGPREDEEFFFTQATHTTSVDPASLPILLEAGAITVHYLIRETPTGGAKDQGYLFKMAPKHIPALFARVDKHDLTA